MYHPRLLKQDAKSIHVLLGLHDQFSKEVKARASQIVEGTFNLTEAVQKLNLKYSVDPEYLQSSLALEFIPGATTYDDLTDDQLRSFLSSKAKESKDYFTLSSLDKILYGKLHMDMQDRSATSRILSLFVACHSLLCRNGPSCAFEKIRSCN